MELLVVFVLILILPANAQSPFDRSFRRQPSDRRRQPTEANRRFQDQAPPDIIVPSDRNIPRQSDRQVDVVPLERGPFDRSRPRMSIGQMETSNRAQMDAGGQGEMMIEGEIPVPKRMLKAARQFQGGFNEPRRGSSDRGLRRGFDNRRGNRFDRNPPPPPADTFSGSQRDQQSPGPVDGRQNQFDGARDRRRDLQPRDRNTGNEPRGFDRRRDPGRNFGLEPRRDRTGRGQLETSNQGSLDMGASGNLGVDIQLEGPAALLDPTGSGQFDPPRDRQGQFDRARSDRQPSDRGNIRDPRQGRFDRTTDPRLDASNQIDPLRSGSSTRGGRFDGTGQGSFDSTRDRGTRPGRFDGPRQGDARRDRRFNVGREGPGAQQEPAGTLRDRGLAPPRKEGIETLPAGPVDMRGGRRPDTSVPTGSSQPGPGGVGVRRPGQRSVQGQMEATNNATLDAAGSGEVLMEGEIQIPTKVLKSAIKDVIREEGIPLLGGLNPDNSTRSLSTSRPGLPSINQPSQSRQDLSQAGNNDRLGTSGFDSSQQGQDGVNVDRQGTGRLDGPQQDKGGFDASGNIEPRGFDRRRGSSTNFGLEPRRDRTGRGQLETSNQGSLDMGASGNIGVDIQLEGPAALLDPTGSGQFDPPRDRQGAGRLDGSRQGQGGFDASGNIDRRGTGRLDGSRQGQGGFDASGIVDRRGTGRLDGSRQGQGGLDAAGNIDRRGTGRLDESRQGQGGLDASGNIDRRGTGRLDESRQGRGGFDTSGFDGGQGPIDSQRGNGSSVSMGGPDRSVPADSLTGATSPGRLDIPVHDPIKDPLTSLLAVNVRCYADPVKGLSCGIEYPDNQCREKWDFPNPCTRENMDMKITKFVHPYDNSKFLMCGEMGKLYIVQCPRLEIFHAGCGQCVDENVGLTASCEEPLSPQTSNPCTRKNIIDNKLFFGYPRNISKYIHCDVWGKPWVRECTRGEVWDQWQVSCVNPSLINPCSRPNADLAFLYPHPCDPKRYLRCDLQGDAYEEVCDYKEAFNVATQYCDPVGSFYGSDDPPYCADYVFGFQHIRTFNDPRLRQGGNGGSSQTGTGFGQASTRNRGPERTDLGQGINGKPVSPKDGVTNLAGTITIHRSKLRTYIYRKGEQYVQPCITDNIKEGRYHFRVTGDPHSFIQCDDHGFAHIISCPPGDYFDPWTNTCVDGAVHVDNLISK